MSAPYCPLCKRPPYGAVPKADSCQCCYEDLEAALRASTVFAVSATEALQQIMGALFPRADPIRGYHSVSHERMEFVEKTARAALAKAPTDQRGSIETRAGEHSPDSQASADTADGATPSSRSHSLHQSGKKPELLACPFCKEDGYSPVGLHLHFVNDWCPEYGDVMDAAEAEAFGTARHQLWRPVIGAPAWYSFAKKWVLVESLYEDTARVTDASGVWEIVNLDRLHGYEFQVGRNLPGVEAIAVERERQISAEGWTPEHDDEHDECEMALAAWSYIEYSINAVMGGVHLIGNGMPDVWPWDDSWWKPKDPRRNLVRAGALIAAEIDRLDRAEKLQSVACTKEQR